MHLISPSSRGPRIASHRIASHRIASHRIASHRIASNPVDRAAWWHGWCRFVAWFMLYGFRRVALG
jgi:hypothetical protein